MMASTPLLNLLIHYYKPLKQSEINYESSEKTQRGLHVISKLPAR